MFDIDEVFKILEVAKKIERNFNKDSFSLIHFKEKDIFENTDKIISISTKLDYAMGNFFDLEKLDKVFFDLNIRSYLYFFNFIKEKPHAIIGNLKHKGHKKIDLKINFLNINMYLWVIRYKNEFYFLIPKK